MKEFPQVVKNLIAVTVGSLVVALLLVAFTFSDLQSIQFLTFFLIALAHCLFIGFPLYFLVPLSLKRHWYVATLGGFFIGVIPISIIMFHDLLVLISGTLGAIGATTAWFVWIKLGYDFEKFNRRMT